MAISEVSSVKPKVSTSTRYTKQKQTAAILCGKVREPPQVADTHRTSGGSKDKSDLSGETACFLFHDYETPIHISYYNIV